MEQTIQEIVKKIQGLDEMYVLFGRGTRMPFLICAPDTYEDQVWIFKTQEAAEAEATKRQDENKDLLTVMKIEKRQMLGFFGSLYLLGVNEIVFTAEEVSKIALEKLVVRPDFEKLFQGQAVLVNPVMQMSGLYFMQEVHRQVPQKEKARLAELEEEMVANLVRSSFLMALDVKKVEGEEGKQQIQLPCVKNQDGMMFQPIFTDFQEFQKFNREGKFRATKVEFTKIESMLAKEMQGIVVNPQGMNAVIKKEMIPTMIKRFAHLMEA
jgi:hypothetical protein